MIRGNSNLHTSLRNNCGNMSKRLFRDLTVSYTFLIILISMFNLLSYCIKLC